MPSLRPYKGTCRKLVLGIDVGTTYSGVAYTILDPGEVPTIHDVTQFPGQHAGDTKIPSILYYRQDGTLHSVGAEAEKHGMDVDVEAEDDEFVFVEWFKLHLRPEHLDSESLKEHELCHPLPAGKTAVDVFADFLAYLFACTRKYVCEHHGNGDSLWRSVEKQIEFILSHPNGWEGLQQDKMRQAAVKSGLVPNTAAGHARIHFITEGEASLNFCIQSGLGGGSMQSGKRLIVVDAGGGTVDISGYEFFSMSPVSVEEIASADCILQGSVLVNVRAKNYLKELLKTSHFGNDDDLKSMYEFFDRSTKKVFEDEKKPSYIKFGSRTCNDPKVNIRRGQLTIAGGEMASFFQPSLDAIVDAVQKQREQMSQPPATVFLVGGFAANPWLYTTLGKTLEAQGITLFRPDSHTNKAVANGAVCFYLEHFVSVRVMKMTYGMEVLVDYDDKDPEHVARRGGLVTRRSGRLELRNGFSVILAKGKRVRDSEEISMPYCVEARDAKTLNSVVAEVMCYRGKDFPRWVDVEPELYAQLCTIYGDTSGVVKRPKDGPKGPYYEQDFNVILLCGLTELKAQISWLENGVEKRGPAKIVYEDDVSISR